MRRALLAALTLAACSSDPAPVTDAGAVDSSATPDTGAVAGDAASGTCAPSCVLGQRCVLVDGAPRCVTASQEMAGLCPGRMTCRTGDAAYACREPVCGGCVDLSSDPANCGACGRACPSGQVCFLRVCSPRSYSAKPVASMSSVAFCRTPCPDRAGPGPSGCRDGCFWAAVP